MLTESDIDLFLAASLRDLRAGCEPPWPPQLGAAEDLSETLSRVWARIEFHGIAVLLHGAATKLSGWPMPLIARIGEEARLMGLWEATHRAALARVLDRLAGDGIETVLMKGTAIAYSLYDDPAARRRGDSDLLVRPSDLERTRGMLLQCGWQRHNDPHGLVYQEGWICDVAGHFQHKLDLHWEPSDRAVLQEVLVREAMFATRRPLPRLAKGAWAADPVQTLVHEAINQKWHEVHGYDIDEGRIKDARRLIWSVDFELLAGSLSPDDWKRLVEMCRASGIGPMVAQALRDAAGDLAFALPPVPLSALEAQAENVALAATFDAGDEIGEFWQNLRRTKDWGARAALVLDRGFPPRAHLVSKYPGQAGWPTAALQARFLLDAAWRVARRVLMRESA